MTSLPEPGPGERRYQVCESCWYVRHGGNGRQPERVAGNLSVETPCALCGLPTDSRHYMPLLAREVRPSVPVRFLDGPRAGDRGVTARMSAMVHDTFDADGKSIRYDLELVGAEQLARVAAIQREDDVHGDGIIRS